MGWSVEGNFNLLHFLHASEFFTKVEVEILGHLSGRNCLGGNYSELELPEWKIALGKIFFA